MNLPPFPDDDIDTSHSARLERWGLSDDGRRLQRCEDGYWTPWHIAQAAIDLDQRKDRFKRAALSSAR